MPPLEKPTDAFKDNIRDRQFDVAAVIPAYNEAGRIAKVVKVLVACPFLREIIVVDDGSNDTTVQDARQAAGDDSRFRLIQHASNRGKGLALQTGWQNTRAPYLLFVDADLIGLQPQHLSDLVRPVVQGEADMTIGLFRQGNWRTDLSHILTPWLSGQRCIRRELFWQIPWQSAAGYGFETVLTLIARKNQWRQEKIIWKGVSHLMGETPDGGHRGWHHKVKMYRQILETWFALGEWRSLAPRLTRQLRLAVLLMIAFVLSTFNSCAVSASNVQSRVLMHWLNTNLDQFWLWWGKLKIAVDLLQ